ncbi:MAG: hypothetical protein ACK4VV_16255 [Pseudomonas sp.]
MQVRLLILAAIVAYTPVVFGAPASSDWRYQLTPYIWMPSVAGDIRPTSSSPTFSSSMSFSDVWNDLDGAFFLNATARRDRFVIFGDLTYADLSDSASLLPGVKIKGNVRQTAATALAGYQVVDEPTYSVDLMGGARFWRTRAEVEVPLLGLKDSETERWTDPIVAARLRSEFTPRWSSIVYADVGGFGVGSRSTWQFVGSVNYHLEQSVHLSAGYRHLEVDYRDGGMRLDVKLSGPLLGATWQF